MELSREYILGEVKKLQYLYALKRETRYEFERKISDFSESVADHVYAMQVLATYFLPLEDSDRKWSYEKIYTMITWHDIDEIETDDKISYIKTKADKDEETEAAKIVIAKIPESLQVKIGNILEEYKTSETNEARFVKAIDKIEPYFHLYNEEGRELLHRNGTTFDESDRIKQPYIKYFPIIKQYSDTIGEVMKEEGYFVE